MFNERLGKFVMSTSQFYQGAPVIVPAATVVWGIEIGGRATGKVNAKVWQPNH